MIKNKKIVVTGGAGFIGSNITWALADMNQVIVIDDFSTGYQYNIQGLLDNKKIELINGSICDLNLLQDVFTGVDIVFHQAAIPSVPRSITDPILSHNVNVNGTLNVLLAARDNHLQRVVYASSSSVYGDSPLLPKKEDMKPNPLSPYAVHKLTGEYYCHVFNSIYGVSTVSLRYFNVFGPRQDPTSTYAAVIPNFISLISSGKSPVVYGEGYQSRDFTFIDNVVQANISAAEKTFVTGVFNVACNIRITINQLAEKIMGMIGEHPKICYESERPGDIKHSLADISRAEHKLGYKPDVSIDEGLKETIKWFQNMV